MNNEFAKKLERDAYEIRLNVLDCIMGAGGGHIGGSMSIAECITALFAGIANINKDNPKARDRDKIILSKGHSGAALYAALAYHGFISKDLLSTMNNNSTQLPSHPDRTKTPGIEISAGSLGQGGSLAVGFAYADRIDGCESKTFLILGDGELNEGQTWEAIMLAAHHQLDNLITIVDNNGMQCDGRLEDICKPNDIGAKFRAFGFDVIEVEKGNSILEVYEALSVAKAHSGKPICVILHTRKGSKLSMFENKVEGHYCKLDRQGYEFCRKELSNDYKSRED